MSKKVAIVTFSFNEYDFPKKPYFVDATIEYICVTDHPEHCRWWRPVVDNRLLDRDPIYASYYVRYHAHEYTDADVIVVADCSLQIMASLRPLVGKFEQSACDVGVTVGGFDTNKKKITYWYLMRPNENTENFKNAELALRDSAMIESLGTTVSTVKLMRNTDTAKCFNEYVWALSLKYGIDGNPNRLDEVFVDIALNGLYSGLQVFTTCSQILHGNPFRYCSHGTVVPRNTTPNFHEYRFRNAPVHPVCIGPEYPDSYKYRTEAILLTKYMSPSDMEYWLAWHLDKIGFDHVHVFGNELPYDAGEICGKFGGKVSFEHVTGVPRQYKLYDRYIAIQSEAEWVMPIDDDEFLVFDETMFANIGDAIGYYDRKIPNMEMLAVRWLHLFPERFHTERNGIPLMEYNCYKSSEIACMFEPAGDMCVKCIVHRYGSIHYEESVENPCGGHVPKHSNAKSAVGFDGTRISGYCYKEEPVDTSDELIRLVHCRYWGYSEYCRKYQENVAVRVSDALHSPKHWRFDDMLDRLP